MLSLNSVEDSFFGKLYFLDGISTKSMWSSLTVCHTIIIKFSPHYPFPLAGEIYNDFRKIVRNTKKVDKFLMLGVGGGLGFFIVDRYHPKAEMVGVDISQTVLDKAVNFFHVPDKTKLICGDVREVINDFERSYFDLIFLDVFKDFRPSFDIIKENFIWKVCSVLKNDGLLSMNICKLGKNDEFYQGVLKSFEESFEEVDVIPTRNFLFRITNFLAFGNLKTNHLIVGRRKKIFEERGG